MAGSDAQFHQLMKDALTGSEDAARTLFERYEPLLLRAIRRKLNERVRSRLDSVDISQDVWASFFAVPPGQRTFKTSEEFVVFLTKLAWNKAIAAMRLNLARKSDVQREVSIDDSRCFIKDDLMAADPTPSRIVMTQEDWKAFLKTQPLVYRRIFILRRDGNTVPEIAEELGISLRTVERVVEKLELKMATFTSE